VANGHLRRYWNPVHSRSTCVPACSRSSNTRWTGVVSPWPVLKLGFGYRVPSAQGPETTRHEAELHPITYQTMPQLLQKHNSRMLSGGGEPYRADFMTVSSHQVAPRSWAKSPLENLSASSGSGAASRAGSSRVPLATSGRSRKRLRSVRQSRLTPLRALRALRGRVSNS